MAARLARGLHPACVADGSEPMPDVGGATAPMGRHMPPQSVAAAAQRAASVNGPWECWVQGVNASIRERHTGLRHRDLYIIQFGVGRPGRRAHEKKR